MQILLVEDNETIAKALTYTLEQQKYKVLHTISIEETKKMFKDKIDLIILDVALPDGNGFDLYQNTIKNLNIPTIFLTARDDEIDIVKGLELGAEDYITKPFGTKELLARIKKILLRQKRTQY